MPVTIAHPLRPDAIDEAIARATVSGALQAINTRQDFIEDTGVRFMVRWIPALALKDAARVAAAGHHDPDFNPFLPPEPDLLVGAIGDTHLVVLNKYPVIARHLLIVTREFVEQSAPLDAGDFDALALIIAAHGGLGFYNGGTAAGASQRHKHLQWIPDSAQGASLAPLVAALPANLSHTSGARHPAMAWQHVFLRHGGDDAPVTGARLRTAFEHACIQLGLRADDDPMPPYNLLVDREWLLLVPRSRERYQEISVNALGFAGSLFVRRPEQIETVRGITPLHLLDAVACRHP